MKLDDRDIICEQDYTTLSNAELVTHIETYARLMHSTPLSDGEWLDDIIGPARALLARAEAAEALAAERLEDALFAEQERDGAILAASDAERHAENAMHGLAHFRARVAELESQLAAQQWRPGSETPAADWYQNEEGRQIAEANSQDIAAKLKAIVAEIHEQYLKIGYHTFGYWIRFGGDAVLSDALSDFVEELYPTEWAAAWEPFANDEAALSRDPRPACQEA